MVHCCGHLAFVSWIWTDGSQDRRLQTTDSLLLLFILPHVIRPHFLLTMVLTVCHTRDPCINGLRYRYADESHWLQWLVRQLCFQYLLVFQTNTKKNYLTRTVTTMLTPTLHRKAVRSCDNDDVVQRMRIWYDKQRSCHHLRLWPSDQQRCDPAGPPHSTHTHDPLSHPHTGSCGPYNIIITVIITIIIIINPISQQKYMEIKKSVKAVC